MFNREVCCVNFLFAIVLQPVEEVVTVAHVVNVARLQSFTKFRIGGKPPLLALAALTTRS